MKHVTIDVTASDIDRGLACSCRDCPVAIAMRRRLRRKVGVATGRPGWFYLSNPLERYPLPEEVIDFANRIDNGRPVKPFSFVLEVP